ncbi:nicotinamide riboside transporter PnuC [Xylanimonas allomyrinae]|uniref:Nicotinamide riboside transporter PnuC n=1 Tax=Xylanimonas allomyrinae TaxID=2509459 RepID=A0A4P6EQ36_9MICO|nr:nicotinamide riboside transporter PnuC [Xylanimonas allomyrinae]QAY64924.1 nicotinamide riboside transporter PnuC [Xylanimonas allomyrinae]
MGIIQHLFDATLTIGDQHMSWREIIGNAFGLVSALGGMRRKVWAWPVGIVGNVLLFTVFLGSWFGVAGHPDMLGQAGRQVMFIAVSVFGWVRWRQTRQRALADGDADAVAVHPQWASWGQRLGLVAAMLAGTAGFAWIFGRLGSWAPVPDAWIFMGSVLATYGMARGWVEFWLIWVAVDAVGVPLLFRGGFYATGLMYVFYGAFTIVGFVVWWRIRRREALAEQAATPAESLA